MFFPVQTMRHIKIIQVTPTKLFSLNTKNMVLPLDGLPGMKAWISVQKQALR
jgi:hypothetical protein